MKRKLFALLLAAAMSLTLLAGCSDTASSGSIAPAASGAGSGAAAQEEPYTVTMMFIGNTQDDEEKVEAAINELTMRDLNMKLDILRRRKIGFDDWHGCPGIKFCFHTGCVRFERND